MLDKALARKDAARQRQGAFDADPYAPEALAEKLPNLALSDGAVVAGYWPIRSEMDPRPLMRRLYRLGHPIGLPVTPAKGADAPLSFRLWQPDDPLEPGHFGVPEPLVSARTVRPDVVLVPLLAFDARGMRLGYGAGHYDRTLSALRRDLGVLAIGIAYAGQEIAQVPVDEHDQPLDAILTERAFRSLGRELGQ